MIHIRVPFEKMGLKAPRHWTRWEPAEADSKVLSGLVWSMSCLKSHPESRLLVVIGREGLIKDRGINGASEMAGSLLGTRERLKESSPPDA